MAEPCPFTGLRWSSNRADTRHGLPSGRGTVHGTCAAKIAGINRLGDSRRDGDAGGCAATVTAPPAATPSVASADATDADSAVAQRPPQPEDGAFESDAPDVPQSVNVFGEINGVSLPSAGNPADGGFQQHTYADEGYDSDVTVDPTGVWLAFASTRHSPHASIYLQRTDGSAVVQLTSDKGEDAYPTFSPDGKQIAFSSTRAGNWQIYIMDADGRNTTQVTSGPMQAIHPSFSPDGTRMVYAALGSRSNQWELWTVSLVGGEKRMIGNGLFPSWSSDKTVDRIAFQRARHAVPGGSASGQWNFPTVRLVV